MQLEVDKSHNDTRIKHNPHSHNLIKCPDYPDMIDTKFLKPRLLQKWMEHQIHQGNSKNLGRWF